MNNENPAANSPDLSAPITPPNDAAAENRAPSIFSTPLGQLASNSASQNAISPNASAPNPASSPNAEVTNSSAQNLSAPTAQTAAAPTNNATPNLENFVQPETPNNAPNSADATVSTIPATNATTTVNPSAPASGAEILPQSATNFADANAANSAAVSTNDIGATNAEFPPTSSTQSAPVSSQIASGFAPTVAPETSTETTPIAAPQVAHPPRALSQGALLHSEYEIRSVISRGLTNIYEAQYGDYGAMNPLLISERDTPKTPETTIAAPLVSSTGTPVELTANSVADAEKTLSQNAILQNADAPNANSQSANASFQDATFSGAFAEDVDTLPLQNTDFFAPKTTETAPKMGEVVPVDESDPTGEMSVSSVPPSSQALEIEAFERDESSTQSFANAPQNADANANTSQNPSANSPEIADANAPLQSALFPQSALFSQEDRDYLVFEFVATTALQDYREPTNDERLLAVLSTLSQGLNELSRRNLHADFTTETLRINENGELKFYGFIAPKTANEADELAQLRSLTAFLLKRVFAESATMRLDDEFGSLAFCEETKSLARQLNDNEGFATIGDAADAISRLISSTRLRIDSAIVSDVGQERELNEDAGFILKMQRRAHLGAYDLELFVVADGMGGHEGGEVASDLTLSSLQRNFEARLETNWDDNLAVRNVLIEIIDAVNAEVVALTETPRYRGTRAKPGSTLVFGLRLGARVFVGNVGDSRAYKVTNGQLERISKDHSYVQTLIDRGEITDDEAWDHPEGSIITAHIGFAKLKQRDVFLRLFAPGDKLLLVSDGIVDMLRDRDIAPHVASNDVQKICQDLVNAANAAGGADNITVVCAQFSA